MRSLWLLMLHAHVIPKIIKIVCIYSKISAVHIQKLVLFTTYKMSKDINYNLLFKLNSKYQSFKISYCVNYLQLYRLVFKNKSIKFDKGSLNTRITEYFLIWQTSSPLQVKFSLVVQFHVVPLEITHVISTHGFFGGELNFITPKYEHYLVDGSFCHT